MVQTVAVVDRHGASADDLNVIFYEDGERAEVPLFDVLTRRLWEAVTFVSCREFVTASVGEEQQLFEYSLIDLLARSFAANPDIVIRSITLGIADIHGTVGAARFSARFDLHLVHEPTVLADPRIAAVPVNHQTAHLVLSLTALLAGGAFVWQSHPLVGTMKDSPNGNVLPARVVRTCLRVVTGGRLSDDIIIGAFPESGPWSVPPDAGQTRSVPIGASPPAIVSDQLAALAGFTYTPWAAPQRPKGSEVGLWAGLKLFFRHFGKVLRGMPGTLVDRGKTWLGSKAEKVMQDLTFGDNSAVVLRYHPGAPQNDIEVLELLQRAAMPDSDFPLADPRPWEILYRTAFGLVDAGDLPESIEAPREGPKRLIYVDPRGIGPGPTESLFEIPPMESALLGLPEDFHQVEAVDVAAANAVDALLARYKAGESAPALEEGSLVRKKLSVAPSAEGDEFAKAERHRPNHPKFNPAEYKVATAFYQGKRVDLLQKFADQNAKWHEAKATHAPVSGPWSENGRCDHCGTRFLIGVAYEHLPSGRMVHLGNVCARKAYPAAGDLDADRAALERLELKWREWKAGQQNSLLWRVGEHIERAVSTSRQELAASVAKASQPDADISAAEAKERKRIRRTVIAAAITLLACVIAGVLAVFVFAVLSLLYVLIALGALLTGWIWRFAVLTRNLARIQFRLREGDSERIRAMKKASHDSRELARLISIRRQFHDWQVIIREVVHAPFGRAQNMDSAQRSIDEVERPQSFLLASAAPTSDQLAEAQLRAKAVTVHRSWLLDIFTTAKSKWAETYRRLRLADDSEDLSPENDNADAASIVSSFQGGSVYYSRTDFRRRLQAGDLRIAVIGDRVDAIVNALADRELDALLSDVTIVGPGAALSGCSPQTLLAGLADRPVPMFAADLFGAGQLQLRVENVERSEQGPEGDASYVRLDSLGPGRVFTAASWRMDFSPPINPSLLASSVPVVAAPTATAIADVGESAV